MVIGAKADGPYQVAQGSDRGSKGEARHARHEHARHRQHQSSRRRVDRVGSGVKFLHVPYKGGAPAAVAIATGEVPFGVAVDPVGDAADQGGPGEGSRDHNRAKDAGRHGWPTCRKPALRTSISRSGPACSHRRACRSRSATRSTPKSPRSCRCRTSRRNSPPAAATTDGMKPEEFTAQIKREAARNERHRAEGWRQAGVE